MRKVFDWHENWLAYAGASIELRSAIYDYRLLPEDQRDERARRDLLGNGTHGGFTTSPAPVPGLPGGTQAASRGVSVLAIDNLAERLWA